MRDKCTTHADLNATAEPESCAASCTSLGFTLDPANLREQQEALDAFEAQERNKK
ncbi:MAG TPA: hypothetical protein VKG44_05905 [Candidatus Baltobacteraceae bacterium]|nr:hypothetical protein [Candidatus Baltobacteraceae bacterium]